MKPKASSLVIESARIKMFDSRRALEEHEKAKGYTNTSEYQRLYEAFISATEKYLELLEGSVCASG